MSKKRRIQLNISDKAYKLLNSLADGEQITPSASRSAYLGFIIKKLYLSDKTYESYEGSGNKRVRCFYLTKEEIEMLKEISEVEERSMAGQTEFIIKNYKKLF